MSDFCKQVKTDASAYAICEYLAENYGLGANDFDQGVSRVMRPEGADAYLMPGTPDGLVEVAEVYAKAIELAEEEEDRIRARYEDGFKLDYDAPLHSFLAENDMRISWLFMNAGPGDRGEWLFERIQWKVDGFHSMLALEGIEEDTPEYRRSLAIEIFEFMRKPASRGGMGIAADSKDSDEHRSISEVMASGRTSCIEFLIVYTAIARHAGLDVRPVEVYTNEEGKPIGHVVVGVELGDGETLFISVNGEVGLGKKQRWSFMSRQDLLAYDYNSRAQLNCRGEHSCQRALYERALDFSPRQYMVLYNMGYLEFDAGDYQSSIKYLESAVEEFPDYYEARYNLAKVYEFSGNEVDAARECAAYMRLSGDDDCVK